MARGSVGAVRAAQRAPSCQVRGRSASAAASTTNPRNPHDVKRAVTGALTWGYAVVRFSGLVQGSVLVAGRGVTAMATPRSPPAVREESVGESQAANAAQRLPTAKFQVSGHFGPVLAGQRSASTLEDVRPLEKDCLGGSAVPGPAWAIPSSGSGYWVMMG